MVRLARLGALARLQALEEERNQILATFPDLKKTSAAGQAGAAKQSGPRTRRRVMSAASRKEVSVRMKKYWAERRKAKAAKAAKA
jgi:hypothetical protein